MKIVYEDNFLIVVDKPAGTATQSAKVGEPDLESQLKKYRKTKGEKPEIFVVHRLDQPVSGLLVFAKTGEAAAGLSKAVQKESFSKDYEAVVLKSESFVKEGALKDYLIKENKGNCSRVAKSSNETNAKEARLSYETINEDEKTATLLVHLETGRHHQIRLQLSNAGMPILGDMKYGSEESKKLSEEMGIKFVKLRAVKLMFIHPVTGEKMNFEG